MADIEQAALIWAPGLPDYLELVGGQSGMRDAPLAFACLLGYRNRVPYLCCPGSERETKRTLAHFCEEVQTFEDLFDCVAEYEVAARISIAGHTKLSTQAKLEADARLKESTQAANKWITTCSRRAPSMTAFITALKERVYDLQRAPQCDTVQNLLRTLRENGIFNILYVTAGSFTGTWEGPLTALS